MIPFGYLPALQTSTRSVWVMAVFGKDAPPALRTISASEVPWIPLNDEQEEDGNDEEDQNKG